MVSAQAMSVWFWSLVFIPCWFLCEQLLCFELKSLLYARIQTEVTSAVKIGVGRQEMNNTPATALMTVWPEETVVPTTRLCVKVCNFKCLNVLYITGHTVIAWKVSLSRSEVFRTYVLFWALPSASLDAKCYGFGIFFLIQIWTKHCLSLACKIQLTAQVRLQSVSLNVFKLPNSGQLSPVSGFLWPYKPETWCLTRLLMMLSCI